MATLALTGLTKSFGGRPVVDDVHLSVADGEFVCILGPSGCGKSTTLRMIGGFEEPTAGDVAIDGGSVLDLPPNRRPTAMVFQKYTLWPHMRVFENIAFGLGLRGLPGPEIDREVRESLSLVGLSGYERRYPAQLSGGEQQRVALARALVLKPKLLLLDEPFSNLDALLRVRLREELHAIQRRLALTAVFVTHDQEEALSLADRIAVMHAGRLEQLDTPERLYALPRTLFVADFIGQMNLLPAHREGDRLRLGRHTLPCPSTVAGNTVTIAVRPEDLLPVNASQVLDPGTLWQTRIDQVIDLGHYRKVLAFAPGLFETPHEMTNNRVKIYLPKSFTISEGGTLWLKPGRFLVYSGENEPVEVRQPVVYAAAGVSTLA